MGTTVNNHNEVARRWAKNNPEKRRVSVANTRKKYIEAGQCYYCGSDVMKGTKLCRKHLSQHRESSLRWLDKLRHEVIAAYGGQCACCGEKNHYFLTMDHPANDGAQHRRETGCGAGVKFYRWLRKRGYPQDFQLLCWNCNCGKRDNGGVCPHKRILRRAA